MMERIISTITGMLMIAASSFGQDIAIDSAQPQTLKTEKPKHYTVNAKIEIPLVIVGGAITAYNFARISKKDPSSQAHVLGLKKSDINWFDRWGVHPYDEKIDNLSYAPFFAAMPLPILVFLIDNRLRKDFFKLTFMYAEAMTATGVLYGTAANFTNRLRPFVYSAETPMDKRLVSDSKKSFFAGHVALVATSTFFVARVIAEYHPESKFKWLYYGIAGGATFATAYMRQAAGEHFLSDILVGTTVGISAGLLTPYLHKHKIIKNDRLSIFPFGGNSNGVAAVYRL